LRQQFLPLDEIDAFYSRQETSSHHLRELFGLPINALAVSAWPGVESTVFCFTLKTLIFFGRVRLHALHVSGFTDARRRTELVGARTDDLFSYSWRSLVLLLWGLPFGRVGDQVKLLNDQPQQPGQEPRPAGSFSLVQRARRR